MLGNRLNKGFSELEWMNDLKPYVWRVILRFVKKSKSDNPLAHLQEVVNSKKESKKRKVYLEQIKVLQSLKKRYTAGDVYAKMILVNHGFIKEKRKRKQEVKNV